MQIIEVTKTVLPVVLMLRIGIVCRRRNQCHVHTAAAFVLPVFADDENQRAYVSSVLSLSTLAAIAGFAIFAAL